MRTKRWRRQGVGGRRLRRRGTGEEEEEGGGKGEKRRKGVSREREKGEGEGKGKGNNRSRSGSRRRGGQEERGRHDSRSRGLLVASRAISAEGSRREARGAARMPIAARPLHLPAIPGASSHCISPIMDEYKRKLDMQMPKTNRIRHRRRRIEQWQPRHNYRVARGINNIYVCTAAFTSAAIGAPTVNTGQPSSDDVALT